MRNISGLLRNSKKDYTNRKFNYLTGIYPTDKRYNREVLWVWRCDCGNEILKQPSQVRWGKPKSCGCMTNYLAHKNVRLPESEAAFRQLLRAYKNSAKNRELSFELSVEEFKSLTKQNCYYCNDAPAQIYNIRKTALGTYIYNGVDRINSNKGYVKGNVVPCCGMCNKMKLDFGFSNFLSKIKTIYQKHSSTLSLLESEI